MTTSDIVHADRAHSPVGGSSAKRVMACPGSVQLSAKYPNVETEFAKEGTACHEAIDLILQGRTDKDTDVIGVTFNGIEMTEDLFFETVQPALEQFDALDKELGGIEYFNEQRVVFPGIEGAFGTVDIVGTAKDRTLVLDWKFGSGVAVDAEENAQLLYYAYAAAHTDPSNKFFAKDKPIELFIVQPRVREGEPFTRWMTTWVQLEAFALELRKAVQIAYEPDPPFVLGEHCGFCNAKSGCPLYQNQVQIVGQLSREDLEAELEKWLPWADTMIKWGNDVKDMAHKAMEDGAQISGYKLVNKRATRKWIDEDKAIKHMARMKLPADQRYVKKIVSPAQAEKALKHAGLPAQLPDGLVESVSSGTTLAPESDKRPAVQVASGALKALADRLSAR